MHLKNTFFIILIFLFSNCAIDSDILDLIQKRVEITPRVADPILSLASGIYPTNIILKLSCETPETTIKWTTNSGDMWIEGKSVQIIYNCSIYVKAQKIGFLNSKTISNNFFIRTAMPYTTNFMSISAGKRLNLTNNSTVSVIFWSTNNCPFIKSSFLYPISNCELKTYATQRGKEFSLTNTFNIGIDRIYVNIDGIRDNFWSYAPIIGVSTTPNSFLTINAASGTAIQSDYLLVTNDSDFLFCWVECTNSLGWAIPDGFFVEIAINTNNIDSGIISNIARYQYKYIQDNYLYSGLAVKPNLHIYFRNSYPNSVQEAFVCGSSDIKNPILWFTNSVSNLKGSLFGITAHGGYEAKIPLNLLKLKSGDVLRFVSVFSGGNAGHGAFDVIPETIGNAVLTNWNQKTIVSNYCIKSYIIH